MIELNIDHIQVKVEQGTSILEAAKSVGINIPTMCYLKGYGNHPSCMVCIVKIKNTGQLQPSCAYPAQNGMEVITNDTEVFEARKDALELLLSDHVGDCEAPCRIACPAFMDIPKMNRLIADGKPNEALKLVKEEIALPIVLGYVCSAPCENACRRKSIDEAVSICQLKKYVGLSDAMSEKPYQPNIEASTNKHIAIVGAGPSGLACAFHLAKLGNKVTVFDKNDSAGGALLNLNSDTELPSEALRKEIHSLENLGVVFKLSHVVSTESLNELVSAYSSVVLALGTVKEPQNTLGLNLNSKKIGVEIVDGLFGTTIDKVYACGSIVKTEKMAVRALAQGKAAAFYVHEKLNKEQKETQRLFNSRFGKLKEPEFDAYLIESNKNKRFEPAVTLDGYDPETAINEAKRCLHCDCRKPKTCKLRLYAHEYGAKQKSYQFGDRNFVSKQFTHDLIVYEEEKCIRCGLCVDIAQQENELTGLTYVGRGFDVRIGVPYTETLKVALNKAAKICAESCPTGAISFKYGGKQ